MARLLRRLGLALALALALPVTGPLAPAPAAAQVRAEAPQRSPVPPARPVRPGVVAGITAEAGILVRSPLPARRPGAAPEAPPAAAAQVPPSMVPAGTAGQAPQIALVVPAPPPPPPAFESPEALAPMGPAVTVTEGAPAVRPVRRGVQPVAEAAQPGQPAPVPRPSRIAVPAPPAPEAGPGAAPDLAAPADPRAVARSLVPAPRTSASRRRFEAAFAALEVRRARPPVVAAAQPAPQPAGQPVAQTPRAAQPQGAGLCGMPGLQGRPLPRVTSQVRGCGIDDPVSLTHVHGVRLSPAATLHCDAARATGRWVQDVVQPAIGRQGGGVVEMRLGSHYACRTRNNQRGARISEHGRGRAIDIMSFRLANGETLTVLRDYPRGPYSAALRRMRQGACGIFRTTLGPGSDRFHADHFHFDVAQHRNGGTFCR